MQGVPLLTWKQRDDARRLIAFILIAYEERCRLFVSAQGTPAQVLLPCLELVDVLVG